jgi:WD40 repeat protein
MMRFHNPAKAAVFKEPWGVKALAFSPDGRFLAATAQRAVKIRRVGRPWTVEAALPIDFASHVIFSPDGRSLAAVSEKMIRIWEIDPAVGKKKSEAEEPDAGIPAKRLVPTGRDD